MSLRQRVSLDWIQSRVVIPMVIQSCTGEMSFFFLYFFLVLFKISSVPYDRAVYTGNRAQMLTCLESGQFDVNDCENEKRQTPLLWGAVMGRVEMCYILVKNGAFLEYCDFQGFNALSLAVQNGHILLVHLLLEMGADPNFLDKDQHTLVHWAVYRHQYKVVAYLLRNRGLNANALDNLGATPLHWAAMRGSDKCVGPLLENGAKIDLQDGAGKTPLEIAKENHFRKIVREMEESQVPRRPFLGLSYQQQLFWGPLVLIPLIYGLCMSLTSLFAIPFALVAWYAVKSGLAFKHIQGPGGFRSAGPYGVMCATCVGVYYYSIRHLIPGLPDQALAHIALHVVMLAMFLFLIPFQRVGFVPLDRRLTPEQWSKVRPQLFCPFCSIQQPIRSHHCRRCNRCVARFDHHVSPVY